MARAAWGSSTARLSRDSFLPFASCWLCYEPAIDPVACTHGDIFCRECALSNILAQKREIKRAEKAREHEEREAQEEKARRDAEAQERAIREFELTQAGLSIQRSQSASSAAREKNEPPGKGTEVLENGLQNGAKRGEKRKFSLDPDEVARIAAEERAKARKAIDDEKVCFGLVDNLGLASQLTRSCAGVKTNTTILLVALGDTILKHQQCPTRGEKGDQDTASLSGVA